MTGPGDAGFDPITPATAGTVRGGSTTLGPPDAPPPGRPALKVGAVLVLLAASVLAVDALGDLTQSRADHVAPDSRSEIVLSITTRDYRQPAETAAEALWSACAGTTNRRLVEDPGIVDIGGGRVRFSVTPALGQHAHRKLVGCLEDATIERVLGDVESVELVNP